jgi:hypothetical protein
MVPGASRQKAEVEAPDNGAQPAARKRDAEFLIKPLPQISLPPAHHPMHGSDRAVLDPAHQRFQHGWCQAGNDTAPMMIPHAIRALGVETHHPVPHNLPIRPSQSCRVSA